MGKIIIDTPDSSYYYCGKCSKKVEYNSRSCLNCGQDLLEEKSFQVSSDFNSNLPITQQLEIFEGAGVNKQYSSHQSTKKLQVNSNDASFFYCKNCKEKVSRTALECLSCGNIFTGFVNIDSLNDGQNNDLENEDKSKISKSLFDNKIEYPEDKEYSFVGFWLRTVAYLIDGLILYVAGIIVFTFIFMLTAIDEVSLIYDLFGIMLNWIYFTWWESSTHQATPGKKIIGAKVINENGDKLSFGKASGRFFGKIISFMMLGIGVLVVSFTDKKQGWHDTWSKTFVIKK